MKLTYASSMEALVTPFCGNVGLTSPTDDLGVSFLEGEGSGLKRREEPLLVGVGVESAILIS